MCMCVEFSFSKKKTFLDFYFFLNQYKVYTTIIKITKKKRQRKGKRNNNNKVKCYIYTILYRNKPIRTMELMLYKVETIEPG